MPTGSKTPGAVSYTHLDVYKRQVVVGAHASPAGLSGDEQVVEEGPTPGRVTFDEGEILGGEQHGAQGAEPVSYTHLDVYKRQA